MTLLPMKLYSINLPPARQKIELGDKIFLSAEGIQSEWKVVGFTEDVGSPATAYVSLEAFSKLQIKEATTLLRIAYADRSRSNAYTLNKVENLLERKYFC